MMTVQLADNKKAYQPANVSTYQPVDASEKKRREKIKQEIRRRIGETLQLSECLSANDCLHEVRKGLLATQEYCESVGKGFLFFEEFITCDQYDLGGTSEDRAILFRGPSEDASVAICVTLKGSLAHRNDSPWRIYKNVGDISPNKSAAVC